MQLARIFRNKRQREQVLSYMILGATVGVMIATVLPSLNNTGYLAAWDAGGHLLKAHYFAESLLPNLSGWFPLWHGGFDLFQFYPPLLYYVLGPLSVVIPPELALRLVTAALWIGLVPVTYYFFRSFRLNRLMAAAGTSLLLGLNASFGIGLGALYGVGLLPNGLGFILAIWALGRLKRDVSWSDRGAPQIVLTGLVVGLLILSHTFSAYWWGAASVILVLSEVIGRRERLGPVLKRYALILGIGLLVSAYWWIPLLGSLDVMGATGDIQQNPRNVILKGLLFSEDSGGWVMSLLSLGGLVYLGVRKSWRTLGFFLGIGLFSLLLSLDTINDVLPFGSVVGSSQFIRFHAFFAWLMMIWAAFGLAGLWWLLGRIREPSWLGPAAMATGFVLLISLVILPTLQVKRGFVRVIDNEPSDELKGVATFLGENLRPGDFILSEFNWDARFFYGSPHFINQRLPLIDPAIWNMDGNFPEGTPGSAKPVLIASVLSNVEYLRSQQDYLAGRGVRYVVAAHPATRAKLESEPWLKLAHVGTVMSVFEIVGPPRTLGLPEEAAANVADVRYAPRGTYRVTFSEPVSLPSGTTLALSAHPWLRAEADGTEVGLDRSLDDQVELEDAVTEARELTVRLTPPAYTKVAGAISIVAMLGVVVILIRHTWADRMLGAIKQRGKRVRHVARRRRKKASVK